jgi:hypothetical protein
VCCNCHRDRRQRCGACGRFRFGGVGNVHPVNVHILASKISGGRTGGKLLRSHVIITEIVLVNAPVRVRSSTTTTAAVTTTATTAGQVGVGCRSGMTVGRPRAAAARSIKAVSAEQVGHNCWLRVFVARVVLSPLCQLATWVEHRSKRAVGGCGIARVVLAEPRRHGLVVENHNGPSSRRAPTVKLKLLQLAKLCAQVLEHTHVHRRWQAIHHHSVAPM